MVKGTFMEESDLKKEFDKIHRHLSEIQTVINRLSTRIDNVENGNVKVESLINRLEGKIK